MQLEAGESARTEFNSLPCWIYGSTMGIIGWQMHQSEGELEGLMDQAGGEVEPPHHYPAAGLQHVGHS
jgi:hypothetical protein